MKHKHGNRILSRSAAQRGALFKGLTSDLLMHGSLVTTSAKAKELRRHFEPLVTRAKTASTLHQRRVLRSRLGHARDLASLLRIGQTLKTRPGGYLRLTRLPRERQDGALRVRVDIIDYES